MENNPSPTARYQNSITFPIDLAILRNYHPLIEIEFSQCKNNNENPKRNFDFTFFIDSGSRDDAEQLYAEMQNTFNQLQDLEEHSLSQVHIGNMLYIVHHYIKLQSPERMDQLQNTIKAFKETVKNLTLIELHESKPKNLNIEFNNTELSKQYFSNQIKISDEAIVVKMLASLKSALQESIERIHHNTLKNESIFYNPIEATLSLAMAIIHKKPFNKSYPIGMGHLAKITSRMSSKFKNMDHKREFNRMLFRTLLDYLDNETTMTASGLNPDGQPKKTTDLQYRTIYHLVSIIGIVEKSSALTKQKSLIRDTVKTFKKDFRFE